MFWIGRTVSMYNTVIHKRPLGALYWIHVSGHYLTCNASIRGFDFKNSDYGLFRVKDDGGYRLNGEKPIVCSC
jgi:hypothetical protein